jgi:fucose 4-O-acetylase-like acetyltransferase
MVVLVFVHGYNLNIRYLRPWTVPGEHLNLITFTEYFLANGIFRFRIPLLFIIPGYLFALHDKKPYKQRTSKRLRTLLVPFLIWSTIGLIITFTLELFPSGRILVQNSGIAEIDNYRFLLHEYYWHEILGRWLLNPIPYQLWFIRALLIYNIAYPAIRWCVTNPKVSWIFFSIAILMWLRTYEFVLVEGEGLLFFSLGIWMQKTGFSVESPGRWIKPTWIGATFVILAAIKTYLAFHGKAYFGDALFPILIILHKIVILTGLISCWYGLDKLVNWCMDRSWFVWLSAFAFFIYAIHAPLVDCLISPSVRVLDSLPGTQLLAFFLMPVVIIIFSIVTGALLRRISPSVYSLLTGGRGL